MPENVGNKIETAATDQKHVFEMRRPDFTPQWSREWVIPDNVLNKADFTAQMQVDSRFPENRPNAEIAVQQAWDGGNVSKLQVPSLKLQNKVVVTKKDRSRPSQNFSLENNLWDQFDKLEYHFICTIDGTSKQTSKPIKVVHWHVQAVDIGDQRPGFPEMRSSEKSIFEAEFSCDILGRHKAWEFDADKNDFATFGEKMQNTYTFVYTGHGAVMCRNCGKMYDSLGVKSIGGIGDLWTKVFDPEAWQNLSDAQFGTWTACPDPQCNGGSPRSTHCVGGWKQWPTPSFFSDSNILNASTVPSSPKILMFSICCGGAFEDSLYDAYISRGTKYCVGFKKSTRCDWARDYAKAFFITWVSSHKCDPAKIPTVFNGLLGAWETKLQPKLFGDVSGGDADLRSVGGQGI